MKIYDIRTGNSEIERVKWSDDDDSDFIIKRNHPFVYASIDLAEIEFDIEMLERLELAIKKVKEIMNDAWRG